MVGYLSSALLRCSATILPPPDLFSVTTALRDALPSTELPPSICGHLLDDEDEDAETASIAPMPSPALPQKPYIRELARALLEWRAKGRFPWPDEPRPDDFSEISREADYVQCTDVVLRMLLWPDQQAAASVLDALGPWGVLALLRCRRTAGTLMLAPPSPQTLLSAFAAPHSAAKGAQLSVGGRALMKHATRSANSFWGGGISGNDAAKSARALKCLGRVFREACWLNLHEGTGAEMGGVFEMRVVEGYGMRWSADGKRFRGFVEPQAWDVRRRAQQAVQQPRGAQQPPEPAPILQDPSTKMGDTDLPAAVTNAPSLLVTSMGLEAALSPDGAAITIAGYASLMDEESARLTTPSLSRFRYGRISGYRRVFNLVSIINIRRELATGKRLATATARPVDGYELFVCLFDIPLEELPELLARERRLRVTCVPIDDGGNAVLFSEYSHEEYVRDRCGGDPAIFHTEVGQYYDGEIYRDDLLPVPAYVMRCVRAHKLAGGAALANLLDTTVLGDGVTTLRDHLTSELGANEGVLWDETEREELLAAIASS